jgi:hypothetical protein
MPDRALMDMGMVRLLCGVRKLSSAIDASANSDNKDMHEMPFFLLSTSMVVACLESAGDIDAVNDRTLEWRHNVEVWKEPTSMDGRLHIAEPLRDIQTHNHLQQHDSDVVYIPSACIE